jgi:eukaryotic-like serine/threonine-protein kinase
MVDAHDDIKLIDFGIAGDAAARRLTYANLTATLGTPNYISPEQVAGKRGDGRSDLFAVGVLLYEMLTGQQPFSGPSPLAVMNDRLLNYPTPPQVANPAISPQLQEVLYRALERDPKNRYASAQGCKRKVRLPRQILYYALLALLPVVVLLVMFLLTHRR